VYLSLSLSLSSLSPISEEEGGRSFEKWRRRKREGGISRAKREVIDI
jgi:hypothetical protein